MKQNCVRDFGLLEWLDPENTKLLWLKQKIDKSSSLANFHLQNVPNKLEKQEPTKALITKFSTNCLFPFSEIHAPPNSKGTGLI